MGALKGGGEVGILYLEPLCPFSLLDGGCDDYADGRVCKVRFDANGATGPGGRDPTQVKLLPGRHMLFPPLERVHYLQVQDTSRSGHPLTTFLQSVIHHTPPPSPSPGLQGTDGEVEGRPG